MKLLLTPHIRQMGANYRRNIARTADELNPIDFKPVVKLFSPWGGSTWLLTELDDDGDTMFGLCDLGMGCPELGYVSLNELTSLRGPMGLRIERDTHFDPSNTLQEYANDARRNGRIRA